MISQHPSAERIVDYVHHELSESEDAELFEHFAACTPCRAEYEAELRLSALLRTAAAAEMLELPPSVSARVWACIRSPKPQGWRALLRPLVAVPLGAAIAVGVFFATQSAMPPAAHPVVGAQWYFAVHSAATRQENPLTDRSAPLLNTIEASDVDSAPSPSLLDAVHAATDGDDLGR